MAVSNIEDSKEVKQRQGLSANMKVCGFDTVQDFVKRMNENEGSQLDLFTSFIKGNSRDRYLREKDWAGFARRYNEKLKAAYEKHKATDPEKVL